MRFNRALAVTSVAALSLAAAAWADDEQSKPASTSGTFGSSQPASSTDPHTAKFLKEAVRGDQMEVALGQLGLSKAQNAELKSFAQHLQQDHSLALIKVKALAQQHGVQLDPQDKSGKEIDRLQKLSGAEFDREFAMMALKDHQKDIARYEKAIQKIQAADVKQYAQETLPKLRQHLSHAAQVAQAVGIDSATISAYTKPAADAVGGGTATGESTDESFESSKEAGDRNQKDHGANDLKSGQSSSSTR